MDFKVVSKYSPAGDQPKAIKTLADGILNGDKFQTLLGVTGSGKTFTISLRRIFLTLIPILRRTLRRMMKLISFVTALLRHYLKEKMLLL